MSYDQMERVSKLLTSEYKHTLESLVLKLFQKEKILHPLKLWICRPVEATANAIYLAQAHSHPKLVADMISRHEKDFLFECSVEYAKMHGVALDVLFTDTFGGNYGQAACNWLHLQCTDGGKELQIEKYIHEYMEKGYDLLKLLEDPNTCTAICDMYDNAKFELDMYIKKHKIGEAVDATTSEDLGEFMLTSTSNSNSNGNAKSESINPKKLKSNKSKHKHKDKKGTGAGTGAGTEIETGIEKEKHKHKKGKEELANEFEKELNEGFAADNIVEADKHAHILEASYTFDEKLELVSKHLSDMFFEADIDKSGSLHSDAFWTVFSSMNIVKMAYSEVEFAQLKDSAESGFEIKGAVSYEEVLYELSDGLIGALENGQKDFICQTVIKLQKEHEKMLYTEEKDRGVAEDRQLLKYLYDEFEEYHVGLSEETEMLFGKFFDVVKTMNLGINSHELSSLSMEFDESNEDTILVKSFINRFCDVLHAMASDHRDHWIGLVDKASKKGFFYNLSDQQSQWMTEEEEQEFLNKRLIRPNKPKRKKMKIRKEVKQKNFDPKFHIE